MNVTLIVSEIDTEIGRLTTARAALLSIANNSTALPGKRRGRPPGSKSKTGMHLTPEGRKRLSESMKRRWAERRKGATRKVTAKSS